MQFTDITCYIFFTITIAVSCVDSNGKINDKKELRLEKRYSRRDNIVMIENPVNGALQKPKVIYRRISQSQRFVPQKTNYGVPRPRYKSHKQAKYPRKPGKKFRTNHRPKHIAPKYLPISNKHKKRNSKPRYGPPKPRPEYGHSIKQIPYSYHSAPENTGFGEPPTNYVNDYHPPKQSYGEPPVDSYGVPLKPTNEIPVHPLAPQSLQESTQQYDQHNYHPSSYPTLTNNKDSYISYSKKHPSYSKPDADETFITTTPQNDDFDEIDSFQSRLKDKRFNKKKPYFFDNSFRINKPWKGQKPEEDSEIVVGGQYAEPPARYVGKFNPSAPMFEVNEHAFVPYSEFVNRKIGSSANNSPYVNYKHSNMAFSPQNLNDAFSIVKK